MPLTCTIPNKHVRIFSRCVHCLSKISDEFVYIQACPDGLILKCVNQAYSAFGNFAFGVSFFNYFKIYNTGDKEEDSTGNYKISVKGILHVFKSLSTTDKIVENCIIEVDSKQCVLRLDCKMGVEKVFSLPIVDFETLKAFCKIDSLSNSLSCTSRLFSLAIAIFHKSDDEIIMELGGETLTFRNYINGAFNFNSSIHSQTSLDRSEFSKFSIPKSTTLIFCLKEFRSVLWLADHLGQDLEMSFELPNQPILFQLNSDRNYAITFILSTISDNSENLNQNASFPGIPQSSSQQNFTDEVPNSKKLCTGIKKESSFISTLFDDTDCQVDMDTPGFQSKSFHSEKVNSTSKNSSIFPNIESTPIQSQEPDNDCSTLIVSQPTERFRLEILEDMNQDYFNEFIKGAEVLAPASDEGSS